MRLFWKCLAIFEGAVILSGITLAFVYVDYKAGALPYSVKDILSLCASVAVLGLFLGGFIGWMIILSIILDKWQGGG